MIVRAMGVDAAGRHGWVGVVIDADGFLSAHVAADLEGLIALGDGAGATPLARVGVDIPIGLVDGPRRSADVAARAFVGPRGSSVFPAPPRRARHHESQAAANAQLAAEGMPMLSAQAAALLGRIREAAEVAMVDARLREVFPEASFRQMAGAGLAQPKRTAAGALHRLELLAATDPSILLPNDLGAAGAVPLDDLFDAAAAAWSSLRCAFDRAIALGHPEEVDLDTGRRIAVWV